MPVTEYQIRDRDGARIVTTDTGLAEACARAGCVVTAWTA